MDDILLQIFLVINLLLIGGMGAVAIQHAIAHYGPKREKPKQVASLPPVVRERMLRSSAHKFQTAIDHSAVELESDLKSASGELTKLLERFGADILDDEMKLFRDRLVQIRQKTETTIGDSESELSAQQAKLEAELAERQVRFEAKLNEVQSKLETSLAERQAELDKSLTERKATLEAQMNGEIAAEKERLITQIDTKLSDAIASFLIETMQHEVDLGAQEKYLLAMLEEHKTELIGGLRDGT